MHAGWQGTGAWLLGLLGLLLLLLLLPSAALLRGRLGLPPGLSSVAGCCVPAVSSYCQVSDSSRYSLHCTATLCLP